MYKGYSEYGDATGIQQKTINTIETNGDPIVALDSALERHAEMYKDGADLVLETSEGQTIVQNYYLQESSPDIMGADGTVLTPKLVQSFLKSGSQFANSGSLSDESPVGEVQELSGEVTITRVDGSAHIAEIGTPIYQNDIIETGLDASVNLSFVDETQFAVSNDSRLSIDEYVFDPSTNEGVNNFSVLKGLFVFTSGIIGREDPDDINIDTPMGSIGIRGTIIAGNVDDGTVTVVEGAIVLRDLHGNEMTLANQFETAQFDPSAMTITQLGQLSAEQVISNFEGVSSVAGGLFSSIEDAANDDVPTEEEGAPTEEEASDAEGEEEAESSEEQVDATDALEGEGLNSGNIMEMNAAKGIADDLNDALKNLGEDFEEKEIEELTGDAPLLAFPDGFGSQIIPVSVLPNFISGEYFAGTGGSVWNINLSDVFGGDIALYGLSNSTESFLDGDFRVDSYAFNANTGDLRIDFNIVPLDFNFRLETFALNDISLENFQKNFDLFQTEDLGSSNLPGNYIETASVHSLNADSSNVFLIDSAMDFDVFSDNSIIHMGENDGNAFGRTLRLTSGAVGNHVLGGTKGDKVIVENENNEIETLNGNDEISLVLNAGTVAANIDINAGLNEDSYAEAYARGDDPSGGGLTFGDVFSLSNGGSLDFSGVSTLIEAIETIRYDGTLNQELILSAQNVFDMSESNTLVIDVNSLGGLSELKLQDGTWAFRDDNNDGFADTETINGETYEIWEGTSSGGQGVTLLVEDTAVVTTI